MGNRTNFFFNVFIYFLAALGLCYCMPTFFSCGERGFACCRAWALGCSDSVVVAHGLSCSAACGIFLEQGSNSCALQHQVDSFFFFFNYGCIGRQLRHAGSSLHHAGSLLHGMWDLSSLTRDWPCVPWIAGWILNHWTTREVPASIFLTTEPPRKS